MHALSPFSNIVEDYKFDTSPVMAKGSDKLLSKVSIDFPDGLHVCIHTASPATLYNFINRAQICHLNLIHMFYGKGSREKKMLTHYLPNGKVKRL